MKPRIFIGSSSEGLDVAKRVKDFLGQRNNLRDFIFKHII